MPRIELHDVSKRWGDFVGVNHLNIVIEDREFITLLGPSGCGKTTTLRMIAGLETPTEGRITIGDTVVFDSEKGINVSPDKRDIGFLFQNYALWPHMTVLQNLIEAPMKILGTSETEAKQQAMELLQRLRLEEHATRFPLHLSGGQQQRVAIGRALVSSAPIILADEPTGNLDETTAADIIDILRRAAHENDKCVIVVTHSKQLAKQADVVLKLKDKKLKA